MEFSLKKPLCNMHVGAAFGMGTNSPIFSHQKVGFQAKLLVQVPSAVVFTEAELYKHNHPTNLPLPLQDDVLFRNACLFLIIIKRTWIIIIGD